jgi:hypothetical protein
MSLIIRLNKKIIRKSYFSKIPRLLELCLHLLNILWFWGITVISRLRQDRDNNPLKLLWVSPHQIKHASTDPVVFKERFQLGKIRDGDWDLNIRDVNEILFFKMAKSHFIDGIPWERTESYAKAIKLIEQGVKNFDCTTQQEFDQRLKMHERLYHSLQANGYKTQRELKSYRLWDEVLVCIGRNGELIFVDGRHRLFFAQMLSIQKIPVLATTIHKQWHALNNSSTTTV